MFSHLVLIEVYRSPDEKYQLKPELRSINPLTKIRKVYKTRGKKRGNREIIPTHRGPKPD